MDLETTTPRTRRSLLFAAVGGAAAAAAASVARINPAAAADGDAVKAGDSVNSTSVTAINNQDNDNTVFAARSDKGIAVHGKTSAKSGVFGESTSDAGVAGTSDGGAGVSGSSQSGAGVSATSFAGNGLDASSMNAYAITTSGGGVHLKGLSGVATIKSGDTNVKVTPEVVVGTKTFVLVSPEANIGTRALWYVKNTDDGDFTIHLSESRSNDTKVAWVAFDHG